LTIIYTNQTDTVSVSDSIPRPPFSLKVLCATLSWISFVQLLRILTMFLQFSLSLLFNGIWAYKIRNKVNLGFLLGL